LKQAKAKTHLSGLLEHILRDEEVIITRFGRPVARLGDFE
jgi:prevent-host-death family protein